VETVNPVDNRPWSGTSESSTSAVSWAAVLGGALVSAAIALILLALGAGLGLSSVSPWSGSGISASTVGYATILWLVVMQIISSSMGGYLAGRLRTKWTDVRTEEVYFRDTAHGFLAWSLALVLSAALLGSAGSSLVGIAGDVAEAGAGATAVAAATGATDSAAKARSSGGQGDLGSPSEYFVDALFRAGTQNVPQVPAQSSVAPAATQSAGPNPTSAPSNDGIGAWGSAPVLRSGASNAVRTEAGGIFAKSLADGQMSPVDRTYVAQLVSTNAGISQAEASRRVNDIIAQAQAAKGKAQEKVDEARRGAAKLAFWTFFALLVGAFSASFSATIGGRHRELARLP
jgi:hypothetical protein